MYSRNLLFGLASILLLASLVFGFGTNLENNPDAPEIFGHSGGEASINIPGIGLMTLQDAVDQGIIGMNNIIVKDVGSFEGRADDEYDVPKPNCPLNYAEDIQTSAQYTFMVGTVNDDDIVGSWIKDEETKWVIGAGNYDCGLVTPEGEFNRACASNDLSVVNYMTFCKKN